jgi:phage gp36-like protein
MIDSLQLPYSVETTNPVPVVKSYGPHASTAAACAAVNQAVRHDGLTVMVTGDGEYWWLADDLSDAGLLPKGSTKPRFDIYDVPQAVRDAVSRAAYNKDNEFDIAAAAGPAGSLAGMRFALGDYQYEYMPDAAGALVWHRNEKLVGAPAVLYDGLGQETDGAMTQKAVTDALAALNPLLLFTGTQDAPMAVTAGTVYYADGVAYKRVGASAVVGAMGPGDAAWELVAGSVVVLYDELGQHVDGAMTQKAVTDALKDKADLVGGIVPPSQLPSYVDEILEFDTVQDLPAQGAHATIYIITTGPDANRQYRWSGTQYAEIAKTPILYADLGQHTDGAMTQKAVTDALKDKADLVGGLVPLDQLPAFASDVREFATRALLPALGRADTLYITTSGPDANLQFRWDGSTYVELSKAEVLYAETGQHTDGAMTQKATTDALVRKADLVNGIVPASQLPDYMSDVREYPSVAALPATGHQERLYVITAGADANRAFRWDAGGYWEIGRSAVLYVTTGQHTDGAMTQKAVTDALKDKADLVNGVVPASQLPVYASDVLEYASVGLLPPLGKANTLYLITSGPDAGQPYRWTGTTYELVGRGALLYATTGQNVDGAMTQKAVTDALVRKADLVNGQVPANQLPAYASDVLDFTMLAFLPAVGKANTLYVITTGVDANRHFRWDGTAYVELAKAEILYAQTGQATNGAMTQKAVTDALTQKADLVNGLVPASQLPAYGSDVLEFATVAALPLAGEHNKLYLITSGADANKQFRWDGAAYVELTKAQVLLYATTGQATDGAMTQKAVTDALVKKADLVNGIVPASQLPTYASDVQEADSVSVLPALGKRNTLYVITGGVDINKQYRWNGTGYVLLSKGQVLYGNTGQNTDGAMTQKAVTDALAAKADLVNGVVPASQLPVYASDVQEAATFALLPPAGKPNTLYIVTTGADADKQYRWAGTAYVLLTKGQVLYGSTGQNTDGAMTQKAVTDALAAKADLVNGQVPASQLPAYTSDVQEAATVSALPTVGKANTLYIVTTGTDANKQYRWNGTAYVLLTKGQVLYGSLGQNTDGSMTQKAVTDALTQKADLVNGVVPANQLPVYASDVLAYASFALLPGTGKVDTLYIVTSGPDANTPYRWSGTAYVALAKGQVLYGSTGQNTDGSMTQKAVTDALQLKADLVNGTVPASQLPSYVDDVLEFDTFALLPGSGERGKIYVLTTGPDANTQFRWSGTTYVELSKNQLLYGETGQHVDGAMTQKATTDALGNKADLVNGIVPASQLPAQTSDVLEFATVAALPLVGAHNTLYIVTTGADANTQYRWEGTTYVRLVKDPTLYGETGQHTDGAMTQKAVTDALEKVVQSIGGTYRGDWAAGTVYALNDIVMYEYRLYAGVYGKHTAVDFVQDGMFDDYALTLDSLDEYVYPYTMPNMKHEWQGLVPAGTTTAQVPAILGAGRGDQATFCLRNGGYYALAVPYIPNPYTYPVDKAERQLFAVRVPLDEPEVFVKVNDTNFQNVKDVESAIDGEEYVKVRPGEWVLFATDINRTYANSSPLPYTAYYNVIMRSNARPTLYDTTGQATDGAMTQKAVTDALGKAFLSVGGTYRGDWTVGVEYALNDIVAYEYRLYAAVYGKHTAVDFVQDGMFEEFALTYDSLFEYVYPYTMPNMQYEWQGTATPGTNTKDKPITLALTRTDTPTFCLRNGGYYNLAVDYQPNPYAYPPEKLKRSIFAVRVPLDEPLAYIGVNRLDAPPAYQSEGQIDGEDFLKVRPGEWILCATDVKRTLSNSSAYPNTSYYNVIMRSNSLPTLYDTTGQSTDGAMTQKAVTDALVTFGGRNRGEWAPGTAYALNDLVTHDRYLYYAVDAHTSAAAYSDNDFLNHFTPYAITEHDLEDYVYPYLMPNMAHETVVVNPRINDEFLRFNSAGGGSQATYCLRNGGSFSVPARFYPTPTAAMATEDRWLFAVRVPLDEPAARITLNYSGDLTSNKILSSIDGQPEMVLEPGDWVLFGGDMRKMAAAAADPSIVNVCYYNVIIRSNARGSKPVLYKETGQHEDGAMTQKAVTDALAKVAEGLGGRYRGKWAANTPYKVNDIVVSDGYLYYALVEHTAPDDRQFYSNFTDFAITEQYLVDNIYPYIMPNMVSEFVGVNPDPNGPPMYFSAGGSNATYCVRGGGTFSIPAPMYQKPNFPDPSDERSLVAVRVPYDEPVTRITVNYGGNAGGGSKIVSMIDDGEYLTMQPGEWVLLGMDMVRMAAAKNDPTIDYACYYNVIIRSNTRMNSLYKETGQHEDAAMTQKAVTDALAKVAANTGGRYRGEWQTNTAYMANDVVAHDGSLYYAYADHTSPAYYNRYDFLNAYAPYAITQTDLDETVVPYLMPNMSVEVVTVNDNPASSVPKAINGGDNQNTYCLRGGGTFNVPAIFLHSSARPKEYDGRFILAVRVPYDEPAARITLNYTDNITAYKVDSAIDGQKYLSLEPGDYVLLGMDMRKMSQVPLSASYASYYNVILRTNAAGTKVPLLYATTGQNTDGAMTQKAVTDALGGKADLVNGLVPASQLPGYVDDVLSFDQFTSFPPAGEAGKIYIAENTNKQYRWSGNGYAVLSDSGLTADQVASFPAGANAGNKLVLNNDVRLQQVTPGLGMERRGNILGLIPNYELQFLPPPAGNGLVSNTDGQVYPVNVQQFGTDYYYSPYIAVVGGSSVTVWPHDVSFAAYYDKDFKFVQRMFVGMDATFTSLIPDNAAYCRISSNVDSASLAYGNLKLAFGRLPYVRNLVGPNGRMYPNAFGEIDINPVLPISLMERTSYADMVATNGKPGQLYVTKDTNTLYRFDPSENVYVIVSDGFVVGGGDGTGGGQKLYAGTGQNVDGSMTQKAVTDIVVKKADLVDGLVPASQLPAYVDDVLEFASLGVFPAPGEAGKIYVALDSNKLYRYSTTTSGYVFVGGEVQKLYGVLGQNTDGALTQKAATDALGGKADLVNGTVPANQLPSYVDDVLEFDTIAQLPGTGERGKIYVITTGGDSNRQFRWSGTGYVEIAKSQVLYGATGQNTDGAMTQKATTDALTTAIAAVGGRYRGRWAANTAYVVNDVVLYGTQLFSADSTGTSSFVFRTGVTFSPYAVTNDDLVYGVFPYLMPNMLREREVTISSPTSATSPERVVYGGTSATYVLRSTYPGAYVNIEALYHQRPFPTIAPDRWIFALRVPLGNAPMNVTLNYTDNQASGRIDSAIDGQKYIVIQPGEWLVLATDVRKTVDAANSAFNAVCYYNVLWRTNSAMAPLYGATGQNTDGAMTQKATTDALGLKADLVGGIVPNSQLPAPAKDWMFTAGIETGTARFNDFIFAVNASKSYVLCNASTWSLPVSTTLTSKIILAQNMTLTAGPGVLEVAPDTRVRDLNMSAGGAGVRVFGGSGAPAVFENGRYLCEVNLSNAIGGAKVQLRGNCYMANVTGLGTLYLYDQVTYGTVAGTVQVVDLRPQLPSPTFTPLDIRAAITGGTYTAGELQGAQPAGSVNGMRFSDVSWLYTYTYATADTNGTSLAWTRTAKR